MSRTISCLAFITLLMLVCHPAGSGMIHTTYEDFRIQPSDVGQAARFGSSIAMWEDLAIIGAAYDSDLGNASGSAYVYRRSGDIWVEEAKLLAADGAADDKFGFSVALEGDLAVIGTCEDSYTGSAYVFRHDGDHWVEEAKLLSPDPRISELFGYAVAIREGTVIVCSPQDNVSAPGNGAVYLFEHNGAEWDSTAVITASNPEYCYGFGWACSWSDDRMIIGAANHSGAGMWAGAAYVFRLDGDVWIEESMLLASDGVESANFGTSVSISGDRALVGAPRQWVSGMCTGAAYIFRHDGSGWMEEAVLTGADAGHNQEFGEWVAIEGDVALVAKPLNPNQECTYLFQWSGTEWVETTSLQPAVRTSRDGFGTAIALRDGVILVGDPEHDWANGMVFGFSAWRRTTLCSFVCAPTTGILPFSTKMAIQLTNSHTSETRRLAGRIDLLTANGVGVTSWRTGYTVLEPAEYLSTSWAITLPALACLAGENTFTLAVEDVTPAPYNQPPHGSSGDTDMATITVTGSPP